MATLKHIIPVRSRNQIRGIESVMMEAHTAMPIELTALILN
jgi:hypothetical protein